MRSPMSVRISFLMLISAALILAVPVHAQVKTPKTAPKEAKDTGEPIQISADSLLADDIQKFAEFIGNVKAVQGTTEITADRMKIFYRGNPDPGTSDPGGTGAIEKIVATGNVNILFDDMTATGREAVYTMADRLLVINGPGATVTKPESGTMSGARILVYRETGRIQFEGNVKGVFYPGDKGLN